MSLYRPILKTALHAALHERRLWWFALPAGLLIGNGFGTAIVQALSQDAIRNIVDVIMAPTAVGGPIDAIWSQARTTGLVAEIAVLAFGLLLIAAALVIVWLVVVCLNALVIAAENIARGAAITPRLGRQARQQFWPALAILCIVKIATVLVLVVWGFVLASSAIAATTTATLWGVVAFIATVIVLTIIHLLVPYAIANAVLDRQGPLTAFREAIALLRERWLITFEASIILTLINIAAIALWVAGGFLIALPFAFLGGIGIMRGASTLLWTAVMTGGAALALYAALVAIVLTVFVTTVWTLLYLRLTSSGEEPEPWLRRLRRR